MAGCGSDTDNDGAAAPTTRATGEPAAAGFPLTVDAANGSVTIDDAPTKIVVLAPALTEIVVAVVHDGMKPRDAVGALMTRTAKPERVRR